MTVISVDLAYKDYRDIGLVLLRSSAAAVDVVPISLESVGLKGPPETTALASFLVSLAEEVGATSILIDGPQGWKSPTSGLEHCRKCEHELHTPGKTGLPGNTKPATYLAFTEFSIGLFDHLEWSFPRLATTGDWPTHVAIESFPTAAWRTLGLAPLPGKKKASGDDVAAALAELKKCTAMEVRGVLNHDELQATVAGLAGLALERRDLAGLSFSGVEPVQLDGTWREGYILNPTRNAGH